MVWSQLMLRLHWHILFASVNARHIFSASRVYTNFPSGKAGMSAFRHKLRDEKNAPKSVHLHRQIFCVADNAQIKCASVNEAYIRSDAGHFATIATYVRTAC